ncbi:MAG TPA: tetratricopeptide repeat protein [Thermoanaerobaculia bacterium]|nr:tetratricopeptide repeat protein [Thermoanaerobaculia bacterium]
MNQRVTRKEMKRDELSTALGRGYDYAESHARTILLAAGVAAALVLLAGLFYMYRSNRAEKASTALAHAIEVYDAPIDPSAPKPDDPASPTFADEAARQAKAKTLFQALYDDYGSTVAGDVASVYLAQIAMAEGQADRARELWQGFLEKHDDHLLSGETRVNLVRLDRSQGKAEEVSQTLTAMLDEPEPPLPLDVVLSELAATQEELGKKQDAIQSYQRIIDEFPQSPYARDARQKIAALDPSRATGTDGMPGMPGMGGGGMPGMPGF